MTKKTTNPPNETPVAELGKVLFHGADYNPDQWLDRPEIIEEDLRLIPQAGMNCVSLGIFAWPALEPEEGLFTFEWMDRMMDSLHARGLRVILATPSAMRPAWLARRYEEVRSVGPDGRRASHGWRLNLCPSSPIWREKITTINRELARRYSHHPALLLWHVSNELSNECHCDLCMAGFRRWLEAKYGTIGALNDAWWTAFWAHTFGGFDEVIAFDGSINGMVLDWKRFQSDLYVDYLRAEMAPLRAANPAIPTTTNFVPTCRVPEQRRIAAEMDVVSWDGYPGWHHTEGDLACAANNAFFLDLYRPMARGKSMLQMETTPSQVNWAPDSPLKRPGVHRLTVLQAIAHGAEGVNYFQWRAGRGGYEQYHGAVLDMAGRSDTRVFREVAEAGLDVASLGHLAGTPVPAEIGLVFDWDSLWAVESATLVGNRRKDYEQTCVAHHRALWRQSYPVDVIGCDDDLSRYKLIAAPMLYVLDETRAARLREWVSTGGTLVLTYLSGMTDLYARTHLGGAPGPLRDVAGLWVEEIDALPESRKVALTTAADGPLRISDLGECRDYAAVVRPAGAETVATYAGEFYADTPALTRHSYGEGECWFMAARMSDEALTAFYRGIATRVGVEPVVPDLPDGVTASRRGTNDAATIFLMNWTNKPLHGLGSYGCSYSGLSRTKHTN